MNPTTAFRAARQMDRWLDTMRGADGYGGPVAHWWQNCLHFTGAGLDWRYEGIILGYLALFQKSGDRQWLAKARRAGDDLVQGQLPGGNYRNSNFEQNPHPGGTPHEAACDLALLHLSRQLRDMDDPSWRIYIAAAEKNLKNYCLGQLWDDEARRFADQPGTHSFVPNKAATLVEALILLAALSGDDSLVETYALPTLDAVLDHQVRGDRLDGAIVQNTFGSRKITKFFPYYIARCVPGLVCGYEWTRKEEYLDAALAAMAFVLRRRYDDGSFPQVIYPGDRVNRYPQWVAAVGDILRAAALLESHGLEIDAQPTENWLLQDQQPPGGVRTAHGFASQVSQRAPRDLPEFRDLLPVCGWGDKAFRLLAEASGTAEKPAPADEPGAGPEEFEAACRFRGQRMVYREDGQTIELHKGASVIYRWRKGQPWPAVCAQRMIWK